MIIAPYCFYVQRCRTSYLNPSALTNNLRVIPHAWHFGFGFSLVFTAFKLSIVVAWLTP
ncbi:Uncharacterised protein [Vibrio vulnificus]|nr:Uncharacterised protein [Vibrio vulnificus]